MELEEGGCRFVNASTCDARYRAVNAPIVVELEPPHPGDRWPRTTCAWKHAKLPVLERAETET